MEDSTALRKLNAHAKKIAALAMADQHRFKIAKDTLRMTDAGAAIMGGMTKEQARDFLRTRMGWTESGLARFENK